MWKKFFGMCLISLILIGEGREGICRIPKNAARYRNLLIRVSRSVWGLEAPVGLFAGQVEVESSWREDAVSHVGAQGLGQFMPETAKWLPSVAPETGEPLPFNPAWSLRALVTYDYWLWKRVEGMSVCDRVAFMLSAYNGGLGWVQRDKALGQKQGMDPRVYWGAIEHINAGRNKAAFTENRTYPKAIIYRRQWKYVEAGWGEGVQCDRD